MRHLDRHATMDRLGRKVQPYTNREEDIAAALAEVFVAEWLGVPFINKDEAPDPGHDLVHRGYRVDVKWPLPHSKARNLIVKAKRARDGSPVWVPRFPDTDIYVLVHGTPGSFFVAGWQWRDYVIEKGEKRDIRKMRADMPFWIVKVEELLAPELLKEV